MFGTQKKEEIDSLAHTRWNCKYHIVFAPKYRRQAIYGQIRTDIGSILRKLCEYKGVEIIEAETCPDHIHMLVSIQPKYSVSQFMGYLKGKSSLMIFDRHANLKYKDLLTKAKKLLKPTVVSAQKGSARHFVNRSSTSTETGSFGAKATMWIQ